MKIVQPSFEIWQMPEGEAALALLERIGRVAYKSEDKIDDGMGECPDCADTPVSNPYFERTLRCDRCGGSGLAVVREPSSHKFIRRILQAERKARLIKRLSKRTGLAEARSIILDEGGLNPEWLGELVDNVLAYFEENPPHESVIEHCHSTLFFRTNRGVTHQLVRHRVASYTQESTKYCDYSKGKFGSEITVTARPQLEAATPEEDYKLCQSRKEWEVALQQIEDAYLRLRSLGLEPQLARDVLPQVLKAEIVITANFREWRHIFRMRCSKHAHPDIRDLMIPLRDEFRRRIPIIFD